MSYLNTHARTTSTTNNDKFQPAGRTASLFGVFVGFVKDAQDVQKNGRLRVWIPELGSSPENPDGWIIVNYCSPFAGATNVDTISKADLESFEGTQTSYGMWMVPPDINNQVLIMFINGDASRGIWIGSLYNQYMNNMVPAMAADSKNWQYPGKQIPVAEYNKWDPKVTQPDRAFHPYEKTKFKGVGNQGLITDKGRGVTTSSARRESPSNVFGILTPGPVVTDTTDPKKIRRKGGSSFVMDDGTGSEYIQLATKTGAQIRIDETNGFVYLINRDGTAWVQMDKDGNVDIFGATDISMRAQRDLNIRADRNVNIEAGQNIFMKAAKDTTQQTVPFTYDVNNIPQPKNIPVWSYVGEGKGQGGNIVMQALNNWQSTTQKGAFLTVIDNDMNIKVGNTLNATTFNGGQNYSSKLGIKMTTAATFDLVATGNIRVGSNATISVVGSTGVIVCSNADISLNASGNIIETAAGEYSLDAASVAIGTNVNIGGKLNATGQVTGQIVGVDSGSGVNTAVGGPTTLDPNVAEAALSANSARPAEVKPMNEKINILATWKDPESKFKRNSQGLQTTTSRFPTYEPCPEHEKFSFASIAGYAPVITPDDKTYDGSSGKGNDATTQPAPAVNPGANNTSVAGDSVADSSVSKDLNVAALRCQLIIHEGLVNKSYKDTENLLTGGIGHLFRANEVAQYPLGSPISTEQIETWFSQDSTTAIKIGQELMGDTWGDLSDVRKRAVTDLSFNLGKPRLSKFINFLAAMKKEDYTAAGLALKNSKWYGQVGKRGPNIVTMITQDVDPNGCDKKFPG